MTLQSLRWVWRTLPGDLLGLLVIRCCGIPSDAARTVQERDGTQATIVEHPRAARYLDHQWMPVRAQTLGRYVFAREGLPEDLVRHEVEHVRQWERLGPFFLPAYALASVAAILRGAEAYAGNRFEGEAVRAASSRISE